jgi:hypothetical protein
MEHLKRDATRFEVYDTAQAVARQQGLSLGGREELTQVIQHMEQSLLKEVANPIMQYGRHTEAMFRYIAAALGKALFIKQEDAGESISSDATLRPPDYRLVMPGNNEFFVEVKNVYKKDPTSQFSFRENYITSLEAYAAALNRPLKFALYWSPWNLWVLISADKLPIRNGKRSINMFEAAKINEMFILGDMSIGTKVPLTFRLLADPSEPSIINEEGEAKFRIGATELYCAGERLHGEDCKLAWYMMHYGKWSEFEQIPHIENDRLIALDNVISPETWEPKQGFAFIGELSGMISQQYQQHTAPDGQITMIRPLAEPGKFGITIPDGHKSDNLPLWRFVLQPNYN